MDPFHSPIHSLLKDQKCRFENRNGCAVAVDYSEPEAEVVEVRNRLGLIDRSFQGVVTLTGEDRASFLHRQVTNHIEQLEPGKGCYATHLSPKGRIITDMKVSCHADRIILTVEQNDTTPLTGRLKLFVLNDDVEILDSTLETAILLLCGPDTAEMVNSLTGISVVDLEPYSSCEAVLAGCNVTLTGESSTGEFGVEITVSSEDAPRIAQVLLDAGAPPVGADAHDMLRIEAGVPVFLRDFDTHSLPPEAGLFHAVHYNKGCYVGQEIIARIRTYGEASKGLAGLLSDELLLPGSPVLSMEGNEVGQVTSSAVSPTLERHIAMAMLRKGFLEPGQTLLVSQKGKAIQAATTTLPFVDVHYSPPMPEG